MTKTAGKKKSLRDILINYADMCYDKANIGYETDQAIKEIQELSCDCHIIRDSAVRRVEEQQKIIAELEGKLSTPRLTDWEKVKIEDNRKIMLGCEQVASGDGFQVYQSQNRNVITIKKDGYYYHTTLQQIIDNFFEPRLMEECRENRKEKYPLEEVVNAHLGRPKKNCKCDICTKYSSTGKKPSVREE